MKYSSLTTLADASKIYQEDIDINESIDILETVIAENATTDAMAVRASANSKMAIKKYREAKKAAKTNPAEAKRLSKEAIALFNDVKRDVAKIPDDTTAEKILVPVILAVVPCCFSFAALFAGHPGLSIIFSIISIAGSTKVQADDMFARKNMERGLKDVKYGSMTVGQVTELSKKAIDGATRNSLMEKYDQMIDACKEIQAKIK